MWVRKYPTKYVTNNVLAHISEKFQGVANVRSSLTQWLKWKLSFLLCFLLCWLQLGLHRISLLVHKRVALLFCILSTWSLLYPEMNGGTINQFQWFSTFNPWLQFIVFPKWTSCYFDSFQGTFRSTIQLILTTIC